MMKADCDLPIEEIVAYVDGELAERRCEAVEATLSTSAACRRAVADVREVKRLLRESSPLIDDPIGRANTQARIAQEAARRARPWRVPSARYALPLVLLVLLLAGLPASVAVGADLRRTIQAATDGVQSVLSRGSGTAGRRGATSGYRYGAGATLELPLPLRQIADQSPDATRFAMTHWNPAQVIANQRQAGESAANRSAPSVIPPWQARHNRDCRRENIARSPVPTPGPHYGRRCS